MAKRATRIPEVFYSEEYRVLILTNQQNTDSYNNDMIIARPTNRFDPDQLKILMSVAQPVTPESEIYIALNQEALDIKDILHDTKSMPIPIQSLDLDVQKKLEKRDPWNLHIVKIEQRDVLDRQSLNINPTL